MSLLLSRRRRRLIRDTLAFLRQARSKPKLSRPLTAAQHCWCLAHGYFDESYQVYRFDQNHHRDYVSDLVRYRTRRINGKFDSILNDKLIFEAMFHRHMGVPANIATIRAGIINAIADTSAHTLPEALGEWLSRYGSLAIKPVGGGGGNNVLIVHRTASGANCNGRDMALAQLAQTIIDFTGNFLVTQFITQHEYSASIFPHATNTIRVVTMVDPETREPFIPITVHRFGCARSAPVDNWAQGGLCSNVDLETGELSKAACFHRNEALEWFDQHPDTQASITGVRIPRWLEIRDNLLHVARQFSTHLQQIGWDVLITPDSYVVLEGNNYTSVTLLQVHKPLLKDPRVVRFYKHHRMMRR